MIKQAQLKQVYKLMVTMAGLTAAYEAARLQLLKQRGEKIQRGPWTVRFIDSRRITLKSGWQDRAKDRFAALDKMVPGKYRNAIVSWTRGTLKAITRPCVSTTALVKYLGKK